MNPITHLFKSRKRVPKALGILIDMWCAFTLTPVLLFTLLGLFVLGRAGHDIVEVVCLIWVMIALVPWIIVSLSYGTEASGSKSKAPTEPQPNDPTPVNLAAAVCTRCQVQLLDGSRFCHQCGFNFDQPNPSQSTASPTPSRDSGIQPSVQSGRKHHSKVPAMVILGVILLTVLVFIAGPGMTHASNLSKMFSIVGQNIAYFKQQPDSRSQEACGYTTDIQYPLGGAADLKVVLESQGQLQSDHSDLSALRGNNHTVEEVEERWVGYMYGYAIQSGYSDYEASSFRVHFYNADGSEIAVKTAHDFPGLVFPTAPPTLHN